MPVHVFDAVVLAGGRGTRLGGADKPGPAAGFADALRPGEPQQHGSLMVVPLSFARDRGPRYQMLGDALRDGTFHITEVDEGGSVPELRVINQGARGVLILDGEELVGAKQNRILNVSVLVEAHSKVTIPVSVASPFANTKPSHVSSWAPSSKLSPPKYSAMKRSISSLCMPIASRTARSTRRISSGACQSPKPMR